MPLAGHGLRPTALRRRASRPQLKRDPLGSYPNSMWNMRRSGRLTLRLTYEDEHLVQLEARLAAGDWTGMSAAYTTLEDLVGAADRLQTFARHLDGEASIVAGADNGTGMITVRFHTLDRARHLACAIALAAPTASNRPEDSTRLQIDLTTEPAALDRFIGELRDLAGRKKNEASLELVAA